MQLLLLALAVLPVRARLVQLDTFETSLLPIWSLPNLPRFPFFRKKPIARMPVGAIRPAPRAVRMTGAKLAGETAEAELQPIPDTWASGVNHLQTASAPEIAGAFPFGLDSFQLDTLRALEHGESVVVSAPTGSGKTVCGELAIRFALARGQRAVYTAPLKALLNQKFGELQRQFGREAVGLLTGDTTIQRGASILVMTTEVYRNMLLRLPPPGEESIQPQEEDPLAGVGFVVLDEFHYMNDPSRGTVWEECCILTPPSVQLVALSATLPNAGDITAWLEAIHGPTALIETEFRPVPLRYYYGDNRGIDLLFTTKTSGPGSVREAPRTLAKRRKAWKLNPSLREDAPAPNKLRRWGEASSRRLPTRSRSLSRQHREDGRYEDGAQQVRSGDVPSFPFIVRALRRKDMLPAIFFVFSRAGCDAAAAATAKGELLTGKEQLRVRERVEAFRAANPGILVNEERLGHLSAGVAAHHAGMLPLEKRLVEGLFQDNLLKVVFATETLAAGINMPARSTVITDISKRGDQGIEALKSSAVLQMAGRAGRRGKDILGYVVFLRTRKADAAAVYQILLQPPEPIRSHFTLSYGTVLQMLESGRSVEECRAVVERSFGTFLASRKAARAEASVVQLETKLREAEDLLAGISENDLTAFVKMQGRLRAEERAEAYLAEQDAHLVAENLEELLPFMPKGTAVRLQDGRSGQILEDAPEDLDADVVVLVEDATLQAVAPEHLSALDPGTAEPLPTEAVEALLQELQRRNALRGSPVWRRLPDGRFLARTVDVPPAMAKLVPKLPEPPPSGPLLKQRARVARCRDELARSPLHAKPASLEAVLAAFHTRADLEKKMKRAGAGPHQISKKAKSGTWKQFEAVAAVLQKYGALDGWNVTNVGDLVASLAGDNELWLAVVVMKLSRSLVRQALTPAELAAVLSATLGERARPGAFVGHEASLAVTETVEELFGLSQDLLRLQNKSGLSFPVALEGSSCGLVEAWASGMDWEQLVAFTSLDGGDIYRVLRRTLELLRAVSLVPVVAPQTRSHARSAFLAMNRYPVEGNALMGNLGEDDEDVVDGS